MGWKGEAQSFEKDAVGEAAAAAPRFTGWKRGRLAPSPRPGRSRVPRTFLPPRLPPRGASRLRDSEPQLRVCPSISLLLELTRLLFVSPRCALVVQPLKRPGKQKGEDGGAALGRQRRRGSDLQAAGGQTPGLAGGSRLQFSVLLFQQCRHRTGMLPFRK